MHTKFWQKKQTDKSDMQYWDCLPHNWDELPYSLQTKHMSGTTQSFIKNQQLHVSAFNKAVVRLYKIYKCNLHQRKLRGLVEIRAIWIFFSVTMCAKLQLQRSVYLLLSKPMIRISFMLQYSIQTVAFMRSLHSSFTSTGMIIQGYS